MTIMSSSTKMRLIYAKGAFTNYVYKIWLILTTYPPPLTFPTVHTNVEKKSIFLTAYHPALVNVVCERPPKYILAYIN